MKDREHSGRKIPSARTEKGMLVPFALLSLLCHVAAVASLLLLQGAPGEKGLSAVITIDLQAAPPSESNVHGAAPERAAPPPAPRRRPPPAAPRATPPRPAAGEAREMAESPLSPAADRVPPPSLPSAGPALPSVEESGEDSPAALPGAAADIAGDTAESAPIEPLGPSVSGPRDSGPNSGAAVAAGARIAYAERVRKLIEKYREYPLMARKMRMQGVVLVRCRLTRAGVPLSVEVAATSSYPLLDQAALRAVSCVSSYPPVPPEVAGEIVILEIPLRFRLSEMRAD